MKAGVVGSPIIGARRPSGWSVSTRRDCNRGARIVKPGRFTPSINKVFSALFVSLRKLRLRNRGATGAWRRAIPFCVFSALSRRLATAKRFNGALNEAAYTRAATRPGATVRGGAPTATQARWKPRLHRLDVWPYRCWPEKLRLTTLSTPTPQLCASRGQEAPNHQGFQKRR